MRKPFLQAAALCAGLVLCSCGGSTLTITNDSYQDIRDICLGPTLVCSALGSYSETEAMDVEPGTYTVTLDVYESVWDDLNWTYTNAWNRYTSNEELTIVKGLFITINNSWSFEDTWDFTRTP
jgi:hypothetical protein